MTVTIEPLAVGGIDGPRVYLLVRRVGGHLDVEQMPDDVTTDEQATAYAAKKWRVPPHLVVWKPVEVVDT